MEKYRMTIGLEIHAELKTRSKMFCGCANNPDEKRPNVNICPICMAHPGTLPVINREAVHKVLQVGAALSGTLGSTFADFTEFDRKNYFYPDIPKDYQISQYKFPLVSGGELAGVTLTRIHLEEDTARSSHDTSKDGSGFSLVDFNRAGVPLMELVTEPVIHSAEEAMTFGRELQLLLQYLDVSDANMEKGEMRVEVNISIAPEDGDTPSKLGTKVEVKNINSFKAAGRAIEYEYKRHSDLLEKGEKIAQETRGFDENKGVTFSQRSKEDSHDYRYFPDPDLPKILLSEIPEFSYENIKKSLPETPAGKRARYAEDYGLKAEHIETFVTNTVAATFFEKTAQAVSDKTMIPTLANYITSDIIGIIKNFTEQEQNIFDRIGSDNMSMLMDMIKANEISSRGAKDIIKILSEKNAEKTLDARSIAEEKGLIQKNDPAAQEALKKTLRDILEANPESVTEYKGGKESLLQFFVGQAMKATKGAGNPETIKTILIDLLQGVSQ